MSYLYANQQGENFFFQLLFSKDQAAFANQPHEQVHQSTGISTLI